MFYKYKYTFHKTKKMKCFYRFQINSNNKSNQVLHLKMNTSLPDFNFENRLFPLCTSEEIENHCNTKTKTVFNKFMKIEEKRVKYNETIKNFASEYQMKLKEVLELKDKINSNEELYIENINKTHTFTGTLD